MAGKRFIALTTDDLRAMFERAWSVSNADLDGFLNKLKEFRELANSKGDDSVQNMSANGHSAGSFFPGENAPSDTELTRGWTQLIDNYRRAKIFLKACAKYGLDSFNIRDSATFPNPLPDALPDGERIIIENDGWDTLCDQFDIELNKVAGVEVGEEVIYLFVMSNLFPVTEMRSDYSALLIGRGGAMYV